MNDRDALRQRVRETAVADGLLSADEAETLSTMSPAETRAHFIELLSVELGRPLTDVEAERFEDAMTDAVVLVALALFQGAVA